MLRFLLFTGVILNDSVKPCFNISSTVIDVNTTITVAVSNYTIAFFNRQTTLPDQLSSILQCNSMTFCKNIKPQLASCMRDNPFNVCSILNSYKSEITDKYM